MNSQPGDQNSTLTALPGRVARLRQSLAGRNPGELAQKTGAEVEQTPDGEMRFRLLLWGRPVIVEYPAWTARDEQTGRELSIDQQALLLFYFETSPGSHPGGRWISFSELPEGKFYNQAFQGYTGDELARFFAEDRAKFEAAAEKTGGRPVEFGQSAFAFQVLPRLQMLVVYWEGDEDFPASMQVLFQETAALHLPTDVCAIAGGMLARRLLRAAS